MANNIENNVVNNVVWKDVPIQEFSNSYEISNTGQIRNKNTKKIKTIQIGSTGYATTRLDVGSCKKTVQIHSMVAEAFLKPIVEKENKKIIVKFKDGDKNNVNVNNLQWDYQNITSKSNKLNDNPVMNNPIVNNPIVNNQIVNEQPNINIDLNPNIEITIGDYKGKKISNYPNYLISKEGQVYSTKTNKIKIAETNQNGYCRIELLNDNGKKKFYIHRLVAEAYIPNPNNYSQVNHKDLNKHNNNVNNLEWCSEAMNMQHNADNKPENCRKVIQLDPLDENKILGTFNSIKEASDKTQINKTSIIHCCSGKYKKAGEFKWKYLN
jgi:hypothetical protein